MNDTHNISLDLTFSNDFVERESQKDYFYKSKDYPEAEIQALALDVDTEKRLKISETSPLSITTWTCSFTEYGNNTISLIINVAKPPDDKTSLESSRGFPRDVIFIHKHNVKIDSFLSISWTPALALITPILVAVVQALLKRS